MLRVAQFTAAGSAETLGSDLADTGMLPRMFINIAGDRTDAATNAAGAGAAVGAGAGVGASEASTAVASSPPPPQFWHPRLTLTHWAAARMLRGVGVSASVSSIVATDDDDDNGDGDVTGLVSAAALAQLDAAVDEAEAADGWSGEDTDEDEGAAAGGGNGGLTPARRTAAPTDSMYARRTPVAAKAFAIGDKKNNQFRIF
jgi:hypothetical protein